MFLNSLTSGEIAKLGAKCGVIFSPHSLEGAVSMPKNDVDAR